MQKNKCLSVMFFIRKKKKWSSPHLNVGKVSCKGEKTKREADVFVKRYKMIEVTRRRFLLLLRT